MCRILGVSRSGFYAWSTRAPSDRQLHDASLTEQIKEIREANRHV
jgi:putative transposase